MKAFFEARLPAMYQRLGDDATLVQGAASRAVKVMLTRQPGNALDGMALLTDTSVRLQATDAPSGVSRGDTFIVDGEAWVAREGFQPVIDGLELQGPVALER